MILGYKYLTLTCIEEEVSVVRDNISLLLTSISKFPLNWIVSQIGFNIKEIYYPAPQAGGAHLMNLIIWEPLSKQGTTIFFVNYQDGWNSFIEMYSQKFDKLCVQIGISDEGIKYPMQKFSYYKGIKQRNILSYKDFEKWEFFQKGEALFFEEEKYYKKRSIKDRLPSDLIIKYLFKTGWDISENGFWDTNKPVYNFQRTQWD
ncbi:MAG: hypothetical protein PHP04_06355 [Bacteroidales bacterium]|nr:hypothetical protein [Bacteroidales bacterium]